MKSGDTLSQIAKEHLGNAGAYMKIFELNKDQLSDPDKIKPWAGFASAVAVNSHKPHRRRGHVASDGSAPIRAPPFMTR